MIGATMSSKNLASGQSGAFTDAARRTIVASCRSSWRRPKFWISVALILAPGILFYAYLWWVFDYAQYSIVTPRETDPEHRRIHLTSWFILTFNPFMIVSLLLGIALLVTSICEFQDSRTSKRVGAIAWFTFSLVLSILLGFAFLVFAAVFLFSYDYPPRIARLSTIPAIIISAIVLVLLLKYNGASRPIEE
jgi:hypothetical protein